MNVGNNTSCVHNRVNNTIHKQDLRNGNKNQIRPTNQLKKCCYNFQKLVFAGNLDSKYYNQKLFM